MFWSIIVFDIILKITWSNSFFVFFFVFIKCYRKQTFGLQLTFFFSFANGTQLLKYSVKSKTDLWCGVKRF